MRLIEDRTAVIAPFVFYPALVLAIMIAARSSVFDAWTFPIGLIGILSLLGATVVACAVFVRRTAHHARTRALARLRDASWKLRASDGAGDPQRRTQLTVAIERIEALNDGAFAPLSQHPVVAAVLVPSGSFGALTLLESFYGAR